jgi:hypothetical protein
MSFGGSVTTFAANSIASSAGLTIRKPSVASTPASPAPTNRAVVQRGRHDDRQAGGQMTAPLAAVWLLLDYPWGLCAFVAIVAHLVLRGDARLR